MKRKSAQLTIIILSYNVRALLVACLESLRVDPAYKHWKVIVVDNASKDDTVSVLRSQYPEIKLIASARNLGFSAGNNLAIPEIEGDYVLFLNPDTVVPVGTIGVIYDHMRTDSNIGTATCKVVLSNGNLDESCHRGFPTPWNSLCHFTGLSTLFPKLPFLGGYALGYLDIDTVHEIDSLTGAFMMVRRDVGEKLNWWDEDYFWNGEDLDFCFRIKQLGYRVMYYPEVSITHYKGASGGYKSSSHGKDQATLDTKRMAARSSTEAMRIFFRKHYSEHYPFIITQVVMKGIDFLEWRRMRSLP